MVVQVGSEAAGRDVTETLLIVGVAAAVVFVAVLLVEGALRSGYDPAYHSGSELSLGDRGWIQMANFLQMGVGMFAFALSSGLHCWRSSDSDRSRPACSFRTPCAVTRLEAQLGLRPS